MAIVKTAARVKSTKPVDRHTSLLDDVSNTIARTASDPAFLVSVLVAVAVIVTHIDDPYNGPLGDFLRAHSDHVYVKWAISNLHKVFGIVTLAPTVFRSPARTRTYICLGVVAVVIALPAFALPFYVVTSLAMHLYFHVRGQTTRISILLALSAYVYVNWATSLIRPKLTPSVAEGSVPGPVYTSA